MRVFALFIAPALLIWSADSVETVFNQAQESLKKGDLAAAEKGFSAVVKQLPNHPGAWGNLGTVFSRMGRFAQAEKAYETALQFAPNEPGLWINLGLVYVKRKDFAKAKPLFERVEKSRLASAQSKEMLAACQIHTGEAEKALTTLNAMEPSASVVYLRGIAYLKLKQTIKAKAEFNQLFAAATAPAQAHYLLGQAYAGSGMLDDALASFHKALELQPDLHAARLEAAKTYIAQRNNEKAERELRALVKMTPHNPEPAYYLSALLVTEDRGQIALPVLQKLAAVQPDSWSTRYYLGRALMQSGRQQEGISAFEAAAKLAPEQSAVWYQLTRAYQAAGRMTDAQKARERLAGMKRQLVEDERKIVTGPTVP